MNIPQTAAAIIDEIAKLSDAWRDSSEWWEPHDNREGEFDVPIDTLQSRIEKILREAWEHWR